MYSPNSEESYDQPLDFSKSSAVSVGHHNNGSHHQQHHSQHQTRIASQPLVTSIHVKQEPIHRHPKHRRVPDRHHSTDTDDEDDDEEDEDRNTARNPHSNRSSPRDQTSHPPPPPSVSNCFTTPSPSPPEHNPNASHHPSPTSAPNQVLCQLLTGGLIPTSTGKLMSASAGGHKSAINSLALQHQLLSESLAHRFNGHNSETSPVMSPPQPPNGQRSASGSITSAAVIQAFNDRHNSSHSPSGSESPIGMGPLNQVEMHFTHSPPNHHPSSDRFGTSGGLLTTATNAANAFATNDSAAKRAMKYNRPFKAYPRDPLSMNPVMGFYGGMPLTADTLATQSLLASASDQAYLQFREQMLVSRKGNQSAADQPPSQRRSSNGNNGQQSAKSGSGSSPVDHKPNGNNNSNNSHNIHSNQYNNHYMNRSLTTAPKDVMTHTLGPKVNGSSTTTTPTTTSSNATTASAGTPKTTPMSTTTAHMNSDETSQYSNGNSSSSGGEGGPDVGSMPSSAAAMAGAHTPKHHMMAMNGQHYDDGGDLTDDGGSGSGNGSLSRKRGRPLPEDLKDDAYWERRRKNNEAAKRSRDARRAKEDEIAIRAAFLEQENLKLRCEIAQLKTETTKLRCLLSVKTIDHQMSPQFI